MIFWSRPLSNIAHFSPGTAGTRGQAPQTRANAHFLRPRFIKSCPRSVFPAGTAVTTWVAPQSALPPSLLPGARPIRAVSKTGLAPLAPLPGTTPTATANLAKVARAARSAAPVHSTARAGSRRAPARSSPPSPAPGVAFACWPACIAPREAPPACAPQARGTCRPVAPGRQPKPRGYHCAERIQPQLRRQRRTEPRPPKSTRAWSAMTSMNRAA